LSNSRAQSTNTPNGAASQISVSISIVCQKSNIATSTPPAQSVWNTSSVTTNIITHQQLGINKRVISVPIERSVLFTGTDQRCDEMTKNFAKLRELLK
jgi:hypothetical protein